jgi:[ribosomal protein S18]-alanine N-acetyltransferase
MQSELSAEQLNVVLRQMREEDADAVAAIEARAYAYPWTRGNFVDSIAAQYGCVVLQQGPHVAGYAIVMNAVDDLHLLNITVAPEFQGRGLARRLMEWIESCARTAKCGGILLEVRPSNQRARDIYSALGFVQIGIRKNYYPHFHGREDAVVMRRTLG